LAAEAEIKFMLIDELDARQAEGLASDTTQQ
jgi:hypothetical protein